MSFYEKTTTTTTTTSYQGRFLARDREESPQPAPLEQSRGKCEYYLHTEFRNQLTHYLFVEVLNRSPPFLIWQSTLTHCFISDDANGIINGDFSQLTGWCVREKWLYYSPVLHSVFLCLLYRSLYTSLLVSNFSSFLILKALWNSKKRYIFWTIFNFF